MGLLDFEDNYKPPFKPRAEERKPTEEEKQTFINNLDQKEVSKDFSDSPFADRL